MSTIKHIIITPSTRPSFAYILISIMKLHIDAHSCIYTHLSATKTYILHIHPRHTSTPPHVKCTNIHTLYTHSTKTGVTIISTTLKGKM